MGVYTCVHDQHHLAWGGKHVCSLS